MINKATAFFLLALFGILASTYFVIKLAKGYRPDFANKTFRPHGLLVATSVPDGGQVFINGKLKSATNTTISLAPDTYEVEIKKDGFSPWRKTLKIEKELVTKTDAYLFPQVPDLKALTFTGAQNPLLSPDGTKVVYAVSGEETEKNGLWIQDLSEFPFGVFREPRQIVRSVFPNQDFSKGAYQWSPDSKQILVTLKSGRLEESFLVDASTLVWSRELVDVTRNVPTILRQWGREKKERDRQKIKKIPSKVIEIIGDKAKDIVLSPDETKILYTATASATLPEGLLPSLPAASTQKQERTIKPGQTYVYDIKEDRNFLVSETGQKTENLTLSWFPTNRHLIQAEKEKIVIMEYDGANKITVYAGPYEFPFAFPFSLGNKILVLATLGKQSPNLYAVILH